MRVIAATMALAGLTGLAGCSPAGGQSAAPAASQAFFPVQRCVNLANALNAPNEGEWGYAIEEAHLRLIAQGGFDTVRVLINWHSHALDAAPYTVDPAYFARIDQVIAQAFDAGLNVIIDMHDYLALYADPAAHRARAVGIYRQIAEHYADYPPELIIELVNEPRDALSGGVWEAMAAELVGAIRESNPTRTLIVGGDNWSSLGGLRRLRLPDDPYLVATFHYYEPFDFTHQGATWTEGEQLPGVTWGRQAQRDQLRAHLDEAGRWARANATPVFLGEFGAFNVADMDSRAEWTAAMRAAADENALPWCYFDFTAGFDVYDLEQGAWIAPLAGALGVGDLAPLLRR